MVMGAAAGGVVNAAIHIVARQRASTAFKTVGGAAASSAAQVGIFSAAFGALGKVASFVGDRLGIIGTALGTVTTALATKSWIDYNRATRSAQLQLVGLGVSLDDATNSMATLTRLLGRSSAVEIMQNRDAIRVLATTYDDDLTRAIIRTAVTLEDKMGRPMVDTIVALDTALRTGVLDPINQLLGTDYKSLDELRTGLDKITDAANKMPLSNIERLGDELQRFADIVGPLVSRVADFFSAFPLHIMQLINNSLEGMAKNLHSISFAVLGGIAGFILGGPGGALIGAGLGGLAGEGVEWMRGQTNGESSLSPSNNRFVVVNVTVDGKIMRQYIVDTVTKEARLVAGEAP